jgi:antitoxin Phd
MTINTNAMVSITEANQNFSKVARLVDELGTAVILKNNVSRYLVIDFSRADADAEASDEDVMAISKRLIAKNQEAYGRWQNDKADKDANSDASFPTDSGNRRYRRPKRRRALGEPMFQIPCEIRLYQYKNSRLDWSNIFGPIKPCVLSLRFFHLLPKCPSVAALHRLFSEPQHPAMR